MKNKRSWIGILGILIVTVISFAPFDYDSLSAGRNAEFTCDSLVVHYDYFSYKGNDDYYNENPLPGDDYYYNPILPGWYSDPSICSDGENYFMVNSTFSYFPGVPLFHSTDLLNWKQIGHVLDRPEQLSLEGQRVSEGIFAPAISYNPKNQTWYMITTNIRKGNFFVKTKNPFGTWSDPVWLPEVGGIDPSFFFDEDGKAYVLNNDVPEGGSTYDGHRAIWVREFDVEAEKTMGPEMMLVNGGVNIADEPSWIEGPHLYKIQGSYYLICAEGGTGSNHREVIFKADSPMGKFQPWKKNPILTQLHLDPNRPFPVTCAGHADLLQKDNGQWWSVFLACRPIDNKFENLGRETFLLPVRWNEDGFPYLIKGKEEIPRIIQMAGVKRDGNATFGNFQRNDDFEMPELGLEWMSLRGAATEHYSLTENPGFLTMACADVASNELKTPAFLGRRLQHHQFECNTKMHFSPHSESEQAGLLLFKDEGHQYLMVVEKNGAQLQVSLKKVKPSAIEILASEPLKPTDDSIGLRISSTGTHFDFYYASGNGNWKLLAEGIDASYLSTAQSFGFTGTMIGMYATRKPYEFIN